MTVAPKLSGLRPLPLFSRWGSQPTSELTPMQILSALADGNSPLNLDQVGSNFPLGVAPTSHNFRNCRDS
jgi:hypothetical protein